jgi:hypothetical protein
MRKKNQEKEEPTWQNSEAKKLLEKDLISGTIPLYSGEMEPKVVYAQRPEFAGFKYKHFPNRLRALRRQIIEKKDLSMSDSAALPHDRRIHPKATHNHRGEPRWEGSEAERLLKLDIEEDKHKGMEPKDFYLSRTEYQDYPLGVFRKHIDQEERCRKFISQRRARKNKKS